jgi:hypothetical protein
VTARRKPSWMKMIWTLSASNLANRVNHSHR